MSTLIFTRRVYGVHTRGNGTSILFLTAVRPVASPSRSCPSRSLRNLTSSIRVHHLIDRYRCFVDKALLLERVQAPGQSASRSHQLGCDIHAGLSCYDALFGSAFHVERSVSTGTMARVGLVRELADSQCSMPRQKSQIKKIIP